MTNGHLLPLRLVPPPRTDRCPCLPVIILRWYQLMDEVTADIPRAVDQIFDAMDVDEVGCISEEEWEGTWQNFPELLDMMSLRGLGKTAHWAAIVLDQVVAGADNRQQGVGDGVAQTSFSSTPRSPSNGDAGTHP